MVTVDPITGNPWITSRGGLPGFYAERYLSSLYNYEEHCVDFKLCKSFFQFIHLFIPDGFMNPKCSQWVVICYYQYLFQCVSCPRVRRWHPVMLAAASTCVFLVLWVLPCFLGEWDIQAQFVSSLSNTGFYRFSSEVFFLLMKTCITY